MLFSIDGSEPYYNSMATVNPMLIDDAKADVYKRQIVADPSSVLKSGATEDQIRTAAEHIAELLGDGTTADTVYKALTASNKDTGEPYQYRVVKKGVEKPVADAILAYADSYRLKDGAAVDTSLQLSLIHISYGWRPSRCSGPQKRSGR